jgi:hypothetical protein
MASDRHREVVTLMLENQFTEAEQRCEVALAEPRFALFYAQIAFARVVSPDRGESLSPSGRST